MGLTEDTSIRVSLPKEEFLSQVVQEAARQLLTTHGADPYGEPYEGQSPLARRIEEEVTSVIRAQARELTPQIAEKVIEQGVQRTNNWGDPQGTIVPLSTVIAEEITRTLRDGESGRTGQGAVSKIISREVEKQINNELKAALDEAKQKVMQAVTDRATAALQQAIKETLPEIRF